MKKLLRFVGIIAIITVISFLIFSCDDDPGNGTTPDISSFAGTWNASGNRQIVFEGNTFNYKVNNVTQYSGTFTVSGSTITFNESNLGIASGNFTLSATTLVLSNHTWDSSVNGTYTKGTSSDPSIVFSLADWLKTNNSIDWNSRPLQANNDWAPIAYVVNSDGISITGRTHEYQGLDIWIDADNLNLDYETYIYQITVEGVTIGTASERLVVLGSEYPWEWLGETGTLSGTNTTFSITCTIPNPFNQIDQDTYEVIGTQTRIRIQEGVTSPPFGDFKITKIEIKNLGPREGKTEVNLAVPTLTINTGTKTASWNAVPNANTTNGYTIKIGTTETQVTGTNYDLSSLGIGTHQISVKTNGYETATHIYNGSAYCAEQSYIVASTPDLSSFSGTWDASGNRQIVFTENTFNYKVNGTTQYSGTFSVSGSTITFNESNLGTASGNFSLSDTTLVLSNHTWDSSVNGTYTKDTGSGNAGTYIITGSGTTFTVKKNNVIVGTANQPIQDIINVIRSDASGEDCIIQFGNGTETLDIGSSGISFSNIFLGEQWGEITITGKIISNSSSAISINNENILLISTADISHSYSNLYSGNAISNLGNLTINSGNILSTLNRAIYNRGTLTINNGSITSESETATAIENTNNALGGSAEITINDGEISSGSSFGAIFNYSKGDVYIKGGTITASKSYPSHAVVNNASTGKIYISGGTISSTTHSGVKNSDTGEIIIENGNISVSGTSLTALNIEDGIVTINGGTISGSVNTLIWISGEGTLIIDGGIITGTGNADYATTVYNNGGTLAINSGTISATGTNGIAVQIILGNTNITGGTISATGTGPNAYAIYYSGGGTITIITGVTINGNTSGVYL